MSKSSRNSSSGAPHLEAVNLATLDFLMSTRAQAAANRLASVTFPDEATAALLALRKEYTPEQAGALLALVRLRQAAREKFPNADNLYFTQAALEQATAYPIARYRAEKIAALAPPGPVLDLGSGIGGDALALARLRPVHAYEQDILRSRLLAANIAALSLAGRVTVHDEDWQAALANGSLAAGAAAFLDPPRRAGERRLMRLGQILPSWEPIRSLQEKVALVCLKLMPGLDDAEIPPGAEVEFISHAGTCKEAVLWLGENIEPGRQAAVYNRGQWHVLAASGDQPPVGELVPGQMLYEPDPAVIRAGAFAELCERLGTHLFDPQIAYLVSTQPDAAAVDSPVVAAFRVEEVHRYSLKRLNDRLQALGIGTVELKKRGVPFEPESLRSRLKLTPGGPAGVIIFTRQEDSRLMLVARRVARLSA